MIEILVFFAFGTGPQMSGVGPVKKNRSESMFRTFRRGAVKSPTNQTSKRGETSSLRVFGTEPGHLGRPCQKYTLYGYYFQPKEETVLAAITCEYVLTYRFVKNTGELDV